MLSGDARDQIEQYIQELPARRLIASGHSEEHVRRLQRLQEMIQPPSPTLFWRRDRKRAEFLASLEPDSRVLDIGSRGRRLAPGFLGLDTIPYDNVDIVADAHCLPVRENSLDAVIITNVLEIVVNPQEVVEQIFFTLKPGGRVYAEIPFMQPYHPDPIDCQRFTIKGVQEVFSAFDAIDYGVIEGPSSALAWMLQEYFAAFFDGFYLHRLVRAAVGWLVWPMKYADYLLVDREYVSFIARTFYYIGKK